MPATAMRGDDMAVIDLTDPVRVRRRIGQHPQLQVAEDGVSRRYQSVLAILLAVTIYEPSYAFIATGRH